MSENDELDDFFREIENVNSANTTNNNNDQTYSDLTSNVTTKTVTKRKLDETTTTTTTTTTNNTAATTNVGVGVKPMIPPSLMKKKQMISKSQINNNNKSPTGANKAVLSSKAVTYSATTINAMANDLLKSKLPIMSPSQSSNTGSNYPSIQQLRPMVTMEEPKKNFSLVMEAAGEKWTDNSLAEWDPNDFRIFIGDLGNDVTEDMVKQAFSKYPTFLKAKVVYDKIGKSRGFGFVSFSGSSDFLNAMRDMNGKYIGNRPIKLRKSKWKDRLAITDNSNKK